MKIIPGLVIEEYRHQRFLQEANEAYTALRENPKAWKAELAEQKGWDSALADGPED
jgi:hypothetical protein